MHERLRESRAPDCPTCRVVLVDVMQLPLPGTERTSFADRWRLVAGDARCVANFGGMVRLVGADVLRGHDVAGAD